MATHKFTSADEKQSALIKKSESSMRPLGSAQSLYDLLKDESYRPYEDYMEFNNGSIATTLTLDFEYGRTENQPLQWGVEIISMLTRLTENTAIKFMQLTTVKQVDKDWLKKATKATSSVTSNEAELSDKELSKIKETKDSGSLRKRNLRNQQLAEIDYEIKENSAKYLATNFKFFIMAPNVDTFDEFYKQLKIKLLSDYRGFKIITHLDGGENIFNTLFIDPLEDLGKPPMFTSTELAGYYPLLSQGISDANGFYVGEQVGDINNMSVLWDMTVQFQENGGKYGLILGNQKAKTIDTESTRISEEDKKDLFDDPYASGNSLWLHELLKQYMINLPENRITTIALSPYSLTPTMKSLSQVYNLNNGILNPFELFNIRDNITDINTIHSDKWEAMILQADKSSISVTQNEMSKSTKSRFNELLTEFYRDKGMRTKNLDNHSSKTRLAGLYHEEVPTLLDFLANVSSAYTKYAGGKSAQHDQIAAQEINEIKTSIKGLQDNHGDLFNVTTAPIIDSIGRRKHDLFDLSALNKRSNNVMMLQLINSIDLAISKLKENDLLILYGCDEMTGYGLTYVLNRVKDAIVQKHINVVCFYNDYTSFNKPTFATDPSLEFIKNCNYVLLGKLTSGKNIETYNNLVDKHLQITSKIISAITAENNLQKGLASTSNTRYYLRRGYENVAFDANPIIS